MTGCVLEDFGPSIEPHPSARTARAPAAPDRYDEGYNAGWDDAMARVEAEQGRIGERLAERLDRMELDQRTANAGALTALEPTLREIFDTLLPRAAERAFLPLLLEEVGTVLAGDAGQLVLHVAPEEEQAVRRLLDRAGHADGRVRVRAEPALSISQALIRWEGQERRVDLEGVLGALDDALETFLATMDRGHEAAHDIKEARNG